MKRIVAALMTVLFFGTTSLIQAEAPVTPTVSAAPATKMVPPKSKRNQKNKKRDRKGKRARAAAAATQVATPVETPVAP